MITYTSYDALTGVIGAQGNLTEESFDANIRHGLHAVLDMHLSAATHYIDVSGEQHVPREYTDDEKAALAGLTPGWVWQMPERRAVDRRSIERARAQAWERVKVQRAAAEAAPFTHDGKSYDADRERITGAVTGALMAAMAGVPYSVLWTLADNTTITLDGAGMMAVGAALSQRVKDIFAAAAATREQIAVEDDVAILDATNLPT